jgi:predicted nucleic acid-binding protein
VEGLFREVSQGRKQAILSTITEAELLVRPFRDGNEDQIERVSALLDGGGVEVVGLDRQVARAAARIRAETGLRLPDAAIAATALVTGCDAIIGNDARCAQRVGDPAYLLLDDLLA